MVKRTRQRKRRGGEITLRDYNRDRIRNLDTIETGVEPSSTNPVDDKDAKDFYNFSLKNYKPPYPNFSTRLVRYLNQQREIKDEVDKKERENKNREEIESELNDQLTISKKKKSFFSSLKDRAHGVMNWMMQMTRKKNRGGRSRKRGRR